MSCCSAYEYEEEDIEGYCPECETPIDGEGRALEGCSYSPVECEKCGWQPCNLSC